MPTTTPTFWSSDVLISGSDGFAASTVATLADGGFAIVWEQGGNLFGRQFNDTGTVVGVDFMAGNSAALLTPLSTPQAVQLTNGALAVAFDSLDNGTDGNVLAWIRSGPIFPGNPGIEPISDLAANNDAPVADIERTRDGGFIILFKRDDPNSGDDRYFMQRVSASGAVVGSAVSTPGVPNGFVQTFGDVAVLGNNNIVLAWAEDFESSNDHDLWFQVLNSTGGAVAAPVHVKLASTILASYRIEALKNGDFVVMYDNGPGGFYHQVYNGLGAPKGELQFYSDSGFERKLVTELTDGGYLIAWTDYNGTSDTTIAMQRFDAMGQIVGDELKQVTPATQGIEDIQTLADGRVIITYETTNAGPATLNYTIVDPRDPQIEGSPASEVIVGRLDDSTINGYGGDDRLTGMAGDDVLSGHAGRDSLLGGAGDDALAGGSEVDVLDGQVGDDLARGGSSGDLLTGGDGADTLLGEGGADVLRGGTGADMMTGGAGSDLFDFKLSTESGPARRMQDTISDFTQEEDRIDLSAIDADRTVGGNQAFVFIGSAAFTAPGQVRAVVQSGNTLVQVSNDGDTDAEMSFLLIGAHTLQTADFVL